MDRRGAELWLWEAGAGQQRSSAALEQARGISLCCVLVRVVVREVQEARRPQRATAARGSGEEGAKTAFGYLSAEQTRWHDVGVEYCEKVYCVYPSNFWYTCIVVHFITS